MGEIRGAGITHYPPLITPDENRGFALTLTLRNNPKFHDHMKIPTTWPEAIRVEYGEDEGLKSGLKHRERLVKGFREIRTAVDDFNPDLVLIWGDDQYEDFKEDIIPAICVLAYDEFTGTPFTNRDGSYRRNVWEEPQENTFTYKGAPQAGRALAGGLIDEGFDIACVYQSLHEKGLGHAFLRTLLYLGYDRKGFDQPVLPIAVNCYGSNVIRNRGGAITQQVNGVDLPSDPPGPSPKRCMELGAATARVLEDSLYRSALVASSSWSHAFLTPKNNYLWPDIASEFAWFEELRDGDYDAWERISTVQIEDAGQQELLN